MKIVNPLKPFKFWASKPLNMALIYLDKYGKGKKVLLDPFAGSGIFCFAGLLKGMKVIYNDICPYAIFLARNAIKPVDPKLIHDAFIEVLKRPLPIDIVTSEGDIAIKKGTTVENAINWLYESKCDVILEMSGKPCDQKVVVEYFVWDTEYYIEKNVGDNYAKEKGEKGDKRYRIFLDCICSLTEIEIDGKRFQAYTFTRRDINEKWEQAFEMDPKEWIGHSRRGKREPGIVNEVAASLIRQEIAKRYLSLIHI